MRYRAGDPFGKVRADDSREYRPAALASYRLLPIRTSVRFEAIATYDGERGILLQVLQHNVL